MTRRRGYTLLELVVVIAILAMATAMVAPAGYRMVETWRDAEEIKLALRSLARLPSVVRNSGRPATFRKGPYDGATGSLRVPEGWKLSFLSELIVRANGACTGASATLDTGHQVIAVQIDPPFCRTRQATDGAP